MEAPIGVVSYLEHSEVLNRAWGFKSLCLRKQLTKSLPYGRLFVTSNDERGNMRELASYDTITSIKPIEGADRIECARVKGWDIVVGKGEFSVGDDVVYFEIDSFLPMDDARFEFLASRGVRKMDGNSGHVLRTIKLRGQFSQGLILPASMFDTLPDIQKWEPPIPTGSGYIEGAFPLHWVPKTDSERVQNLGKYLEEIHKDSWFATEKIDGSSATVVNTGEEIIVASRNWAVGSEDMRHKVLTKMGIIADLLPGEALQGEIFGEGVQNNPLEITGLDFKAFSFYKDKVFVPYDEWPEKFAKFRVPALDFELPETVDEIVAQADKLRSAINPKKYAEGIVWHGRNTHIFLGERSTFKAINNTFLIKNGE